MTDNVIVLIHPNGGWIRSVDADLDPKRMAKAMKEMGKEMAETGGLIKTMTVTEIQSLKHFKQK